MQLVERLSETPSSVAFGRFRVLPHRRELLADGRPVKLGGRAFDVLITLLEERGSVVSREELIRRVWPNRVVEEKNLHAQISVLRTVLGAERELIRTVPGHGYQFTGEIRVLSGNPDERAGATMAAAQPAPALPPTNLPAPVSELIGRDDELCEILALAAHRLVTLTGPGGIGKTRLALAAARRLLPQFADGVWLAEFSSLADPALVPATVAAAVGLELGAGEVSAQRVAQTLADRQLLLVLDTCEHMIAAAAAMVETVLRACSGLRVIATSREPLRAEGEQTYPVPPLAVPAEDTEAEDDPLQYGAVQLFVVRSRANGAYVSEDRHGTAAIAAICRQLDGIPLAIELAAARAAALGIEEVAAHLDDRFRLLLTGGRRTALPRHQTLRATLDWSYELLAEVERVLLRRLGVFAGAFSLEAASAVAASAELAPAEVVYGLFDLVAKSLVVAEVEGRRIARYRLLDTTRAYALEKLGESDERERLARRHAEYGRDLFEQAEAEWETRPTAEWLADYGRQIDNLRAALDWAFSPGGDASIGLVLTAAAVTLWMHLPLLDECRTRVERALAAITGEEKANARCEMKLHAAFGASLMYTRGSVPEAGAAWTKALEIAESLDDAEYQLRSLWGLWSFHMRGGQHRLALAQARRFCSLAANRSDPNDRLIGDRLIGVLEHFLGDQPSARRHLEHMLADYVPPAGKPEINRFQLDPRMTAGAFLARVLWLQGFPDQATRIAENSIEDARAANHVTSLCPALALAACPIALWTGNLTAAESCIGTLLDHSTRHPLARWRAFGRGYEGVLAIKRGDVASGLRLLRAGFDALGEANTIFRFSVFLSEMAEALGRAGQIADGLAEIEEAIELCHRTEEHWVMSELLRIKSELLLLHGAPAAEAAAEDHFRQALDWARRQGALSFELRAATSLARLQRDQGRPADAIALLQPVYDRFTEGFETADLKTAKMLLDALAEHAGLRVSQDESSLRRIAQASAGKIL
jgi:predicted ATPase/DNA-binding winged helix-turn-helix (wHTH) protein